MGVLHYVCINLIEIAINWNSTKLKVLNVIHKNIVGV